MLDCVATMKESRLPQLKSDGLRLKIHATQENIRQPIFLPLPGVCGNCSHDPRCGKDA
jgi:hypothetical protein